MLAKPSNCKFDISDMDGCILGEGSYGRVTKNACNFEKIECGENEYLAKKTLKPRGAQSRLRRDAEKEEKIYARLAINPSQHILQMYKSSLDENIIIQYFQLIPGPELDFYNEEMYAKEIIIGLVKGLEEIHKLNIIHCDIKGANILIDTRVIPHNPVYIDFGGSVITSVLEPNGCPSIQNGVGDAADGLIGTREYVIESEMAAGMRTARSDIYALFSTLIEHNENKVTFKAYVRAMKALDIKKKVLKIHNWENVWENFNLIKAKINYLPPLRRSLSINNNINEQISSFYKNPAHVRAIELGRELLTLKDRITNKIIKTMKTIRGSRAPPPLMPPAMGMASSRAAPSPVEVMNAPPPVRTRIEMNGYLGGVSRNQFRRLSKKKRGKTCNRRRRQTKRQRPTKKRRLTN